MTTYDEFIGQFEAALKGTVGAKNVTREPRPAGAVEFRVERTDGSHLLINPFNFWRAVSSRLNTAEGAIERMRASLAVWLSTDEPPTWETAKDRLFARLERRDLAERPGFHWRPWPAAKILRECVADDTPETMRQITDVEIELWGRPVEEVHDQARANLRRRVEAGPRQWRQAGTKLWMFETDDGYGASRLLFPEWLQATLPTGRGKAGWVLSAPSRNIIVAAPLGANGINQLIAIAATIQRRYPNPWPNNAVILEADGTLTPTDDKPPPGLPVNAA